MTPTMTQLLEGAPNLPDAFKFTGTGDGLEGLFDAEMRHKSGAKPVDYLRRWLSMFRPFAFATRDDSWGELEKLICITLRNYVRVLALVEKMRTLDDGSNERDKAAAREERRLEIAHIIHGQVRYSPHPWDTMREGTLAGVNEAADDIMDLFA